MHNKGHSRYKHPVSRSLRSSGSRWRGSSFYSGSADSFPQAKRVGGTSSSGQAQALPLVENARRFISSTKNNPDGKAFLDLSRCVDFPEVGDPYELLNEIDASGYKNGNKKFKPTYISAKVIKSDPNTCQFVLESDDGKKVTNDKTYTLGNQLYVYGFLPSIIFASVYLQSPPKSANVNFDEEFDKEFKYCKRNIFKKPRSGYYYGSTTESDSTEQAVFSQINFKPDGQVTGRGRDGNDGDYTINGQWTPSKVKWTEIYEGGPNGNFKVAVRGKFNTATKTIDCKFTSTKGLRGKFILIFRG